MLSPVMPASGRLRTSKRRTVTAAGVSLLLALVACGGDDDTASPATTSAPAATTASAAASDTASPTPSATDTASASPSATAETSAPANTGDKVTVNWFVGLGTGADQGQPAKQQKIVDAFNKSQNEITLKMTVVANVNAAKTLATQISGGKSPDLVGPVGIRGANQFEGQWLDLQPLIDKSGFDTSIFDPEALKSQTDIEGKQVALPFAVFPSAIWVNKELFDEAGLPLPPQKHGEPYEGQPWTWNALRELAKQLTVDANGKDATEEGFDPTKIVQWGFHTQFSENNLQRTGSLFGAGSFGAEDKKTAQIPSQWLDAWKWRHDMIWKDHSSPNAKQLASDTLNKGNAFQTGKVAMASTHLWYTCCVKDSKDNALTFWDFAATPSNEDGKITAPLHSDSFRILKGSKNPDAAFKVLTYFLTEATPELLKIYGAMPADPELQDAHFAAMDETWTQKPNWDVIREALNHPDVPNHESWTPAFTKTEDRANVLGAKIMGEENLDLDAEAKKMQADMQKLFDAAK